MKHQHAKRIEALERSSLPRGIIAKWFTNSEPFETFERYLEYLLTGSTEATLAGLARFDVESPKGKGTNQTTPGPQRPSLSHLCFLGKLFLGLNSRADDLISRGRQRLDSTEVILRIESLHPASNPTSRWTDAIDRGKFAAWLVRARGDITSILRELQSLRLTCERLSRKYAEGHDLLFKPLAVKVAELHERTQAYAHEYARTLRELLSGPVPSDTGWPPDFCEIDFQAIEELAVSETDMIVRKLVDCAKAEMLIAFDRIPEALATLKPYLEADVADLGEE